MRGAKFISKQNVNQIFQTVEAILQTNELLLAKFDAVIGVCNWRVRGCSALCNALRAASNTDDSGDAVVVGICEEFKKLAPFLRMYADFANNQINSLMVCVPVFVSYHSSNLCV